MLLDFWDLLNVYTVIVNASVNSTCAQPPPPGNCGAFARLVRPGSGAFANFALPGGRALANPLADSRAFDTHAVFYQNITTQKVLLEKKTLIETKNRTLKWLKWHYLTVQAMKNVAVFTEDGAFALFFRPHPWGFDSLRVPTPGNLPSKAKKMLMPGGQPAGGWGWAQVELTDASRSDVL